MKFIDLDFAVEDALDAIETAVYHTECLVDECDGQWEELNEMLIQMSVILASWKKIIPPSVKEAIQGEVEDAAKYD